jgi:hypothetical protein
VENTRNPDPCKTIKIRIPVKPYIQKVTYPDVDNAGLVLRVEGDLEDVAEAGVEEAGVVPDLNAAAVEGGPVGPQVEEFCGSFPAGAAHLLPSTLHQYVSLEPFSSGFWLKFRKIRGLGFFY